MGKTSLSRFKNESLIRGYWRVNGDRCELSPYLTGEELAEVEVMRKTNINKGRELHHILLQPHYKVEYWSNVIILEDYSLHQAWGHQHNFTALSVLCLYAKLRKAEFDVFELNVCSKRPTITNQILYFRNEISNKPEYKSQKRHLDMCEEMLATLPEPA